MVSRQIGIRATMQVCSRWNAAGSLANWKLNFSQTYLPFSPSHRAVVTDSRAKSRVFQFTSCRNSLRPTLDSRRARARASLAGKRRLGAMRKHRYQSRPVSLFLVLHKPSSISVARATLLRALASPRTWMHI